MADHKAARERCTTFLKEKTKPVDPQDLPVLDECPICLDNYVLEQCVQIKIEGCNHIFGRNCLTAILTNNPRLAKKCPLCRTVWMEAPTPAPALGSWARVAESHRSGQAAAAATADSVRRAHGGITLPSGAPGPRLLHEASVIGSRRLASPQVPGPPRLFRERQREDPVINLINSDDDQDPLESFNSITRDINSVRERARTTQGSRRQRKEDKKKEAAAPNSRKTTTIKRENASGNDATGDNSQRQPGQPQPQQQEQPTPFPNSFWNPTPRARPTPQTLAERIQRNWGLPNSTQDGTQAADLTADDNETAAMDVDDAGTTQDSEQNPPRLPLLGEFPPGETPSSPLFVSYPPLFGPRSNSLRQNRRSRAPPNPFVLSPTPENDTIEPADVDTQPQLEWQARLDQREKDLHERETRLNNREQNLDTREHDLAGRQYVLEARETTLAQREERLRQRAGNDARLGVVRQKQLRELEVMVARHREEMRG